MRIMIMITIMIMIMMMTMLVMMMMMLIKSDNPKMVMVMVMVMMNSKQAEKSIFLKYLIYVSLTPPNNYQKTVPQVDRIDYPQI